MSKHGDPRALDLQIGDRLEALVKGEWKPGKTAGWIGAMVSVDLDDGTHNWFALNELRVPWDEKAKIHARYEATKEETR